MRRNRWIMVAGGVVTLSSVAGTHAQRLAEWPVRTSAMPDAITLGAAAVFWNPAGLRTGDYRAEVMVLNLRTPEMLELSGLAAAGAVRFERTTLGAAYEHIGVSEFTRTTTQPNDPDAQRFDLGEDHFTLAAARQLSKPFTVGAIARLARDNLDETDETVGVGAGFILDLPVKLQPLIGAYAMSEDQEVAWGGAVEVQLPKVFGADYQVGIGYGLQSDARVDAPVHRAGVRLDWKERASVSAGLSREPEAEDPLDADRSGARWAPIVAASLRLNRYTLGVVRENLLNDFGATYSFRLQAGLGR